MFYLLKNILLLIIVIFKQKCNNLIFNEIIVLNAFYVCLHAFSLHRESPDLDLGRQTPHLGGGGVLPHKTFVRKQFFPCPCDAKDSENIITKKQHSVETK
jgi:hypothetical protein